MKSLPIIREPGSDRAYVECASGKLPVHTRCSYCMNCKGIQVGARVMPSPYESAFSRISGGSVPPEMLMEAAMQFNSLVRDGSAVACNDEKGEGYTPRFASRL
ncbi:MAG TPA: hypothetical protein PLG55_01520 [Methanospirillum sp.]|uniref:hypothetical protein n=1 Tax=Methanospirillum sp. TaxID=45200 RepID=UPI0016AB3F9B|nr:hypothetical protein [Methanospirillum sp.]NLL10813.1 hypothetical protein [Methanomicrobiales archaeon]HPY59388.1 hypothetical protein [Methanospirillum sp.]